MCKRPLSTEESEEIIQVTHVGKRYIFRIVCTKSERYLGPDEFIQIH